MNWEEGAKTQAARARRYERKFRDCERQLADCRELVRELWERLRLYRETVGVEPERKHGLDPETLRAAGVDAVTEAGPTGRPPSPPGHPATERPSGDDGGAGSRLGDGEETPGEPVEWTDESVSDEHEPRDAFGYEEPDPDAGVGDRPAEDGPNEDDEDGSGFFSRFF